MKKVLARMKINRRQCITYAFVIAAYIVLQILSGQKLLSSTARGMLVPICAYVVMAISLNLTVGVMGELSLGHAGFMSVGAFMGTTAAVSLQGVIASAPLRLAIAMVIGAIFAAIIGFLIGIPVLRLHGALAPYKAAILPLSKKLAGPAEELLHKLSKDFMVDYDDAGSIGKRYRRQDEIGTPYCITVDFQTVGDENTPADNCVTIRERDSMEQVRLPIDQVAGWLAEKVAF